MKYTKGKNFNWNSYLYDKAIVEFERENGLQTINPGLNSYYLLSYFINLYIDPKKSKKIKYEYIDGSKYIYVSTSFILNNLLLLKINKRSLVRLIEKLIKYGYIKRSIEFGCLRYIKISDELLKFCLPNKMNKTNITSIEALSIKIGKYFGKTTQNQLLDVKKFLYSVTDIDYFTEQFDNYITFKEYSNEQLHRFSSFVHIWDKESWDFLLKQQEHIEDKRKIENLF